MLCLPSHTPQLVLCSTANTNHNHTITVTLANPRQDRDEVLRAPRGRGWKQL